MVDSHDTTRQGRAADIGVDAEANEIYVADGCGNRRVIVFDADTGEHKRHRGACGRPPVDGELEPYDQQADASPIRAGSERTSHQGIENSG